VIAGYRDRTPLMSSISRRESAGLSVKSVSVAVKRPVCCAGMQMRLSPFRTDGGQSDSKLGGDAEGGNIGPRYSRN
jgi:hypothetical protein